jgi:hypothetical protein
MCVLFLPVLCHIALLVSPKGAKISWRLPNKLQDVAF